MSNYTPHSTSPLVHLWLQVLQLAMPDVAAPQMQQWRLRLLSATSVDQQRDRLQQFLHFSQAQLLSTYERELATAAHQLQRWISINRRQNEMKSSAKADKNATTQHLQRSSSKGELEALSNAFGRTNSSQAQDALQTGQHSLRKDQDGKRIMNSNHKQEPNRAQDNDEPKRWHHLIKHFWPNHNSSSILMLTVAGLFLLLINIFILCFAYQKSNKKRDRLLNSSNVESTNANDCARSDAASEALTTTKDAFSSATLKMGKSGASLDLCERSSPENNDKLAAKLLPIGFASLTCSSSAGTDASDEVYHMYHADSVGPFTFAQPTYDTGNMAIDQKSQTFLYAQIQLADQQQQQQSQTPEFAKSVHKRSVQFADFPTMNNNNGKSCDSPSSFGMYCDCGLIDVVQPQPTASLLASLLKKESNNEKVTLLSSDSPIALPMLHSPCIISTCHNSTHGSQPHHAHSQFFQDHSNTGQASVSSTPASSSSVIVNGQQLFSSINSSQVSPMAGDAATYSVTLQTDVPHQSNYCETSLFGNRNQMSS